jgi:hypothetical protein
MKNIIISFLFVVLALSSCTETNTVINPGEKPVVQAYLATGSIVSMKIYKEIPYSNDSSGTSQPISGLSVKITENGNTSFILKEVSPGLYESDAKNIVKSTGSKYSFEFSYLNKTISATTAIPPKPKNYKLSTNEIKRNLINLSGGFGGGFGGGGFGALNSEDNTPIEATWDNPDAAFHFLAVNINEAYPETIVTLPSGIERPNIRFTNSPVSGVVSNIQPRSFQYFGKHKAILYRVNEDYAVLYQSSGSTTQNLSTPPSSITNGLGIFTGINADTLDITVKKL